jgi:hypothetical protein
MSFIHICDACGEKFWGLSEGTCPSCLVELGLVEELEDGDIEDDY